MVMITAVLIMFWTFGAIALVCELGERVAKQFDLFDDKLNLCKWYLFPIDVQRMLLIFICDTQQPKFVRGFGNIICTRDSFKSVCDFNEIIKKEKWQKKPRILTGDFFYMHTCP